MATTGRPTKYNDELVAKAQNYLLNYADLGDVVPTVAGLACELKIARDTVYDWSSQEDKEIFSDIVKGIASEQERMLINGGLSNTMNAMITKLLLSKHGYAESQKIDNTSSDGSMVSKDLNITVVAPKPE